MQSQSNVDLINFSKISPPEFPLEVPFTLEEIAAQEPTSRTLSHLTPSTTTTTKAINNSGSSRVSSTDKSRIASTTFTTPGVGQRHRGVDSISRGRSSLKGLGLNNGVDAHSELDDSEYDRRRDLGRESATEYETSIETFGSMDIGSPGFMHHRGSISGPHPTHRQSFDSFGRRSSESPTVASAMAAVVNNTTTSSSAAAIGKGKQPGLVGLIEMEKVVAAAAAAAKEKEKERERDTVTLTEEEEAAVRDMVGGVSGADDWSIVVVSTMQLNSVASCRSFTPITPTCSNRQLTLLW
jgi:hypothetical protein